MILKRGLAKLGLRSSSAQLRKLTISRTGKRQPGQLATAPSDYNNESNLNKTRCCYSKPAASHSRAETATILSYSEVEHPAEASASARVDSIRSRAK